MNQRDKTDLWLMLGSVVFIIFMAWVYSFSRTFWMGFATACIVAAAWSIIYRQQHPKGGKLRAPVMDYETGELRRGDETEVH
jgi:predicted membrane metal-binding protein